MSSSLSEQNLQKKFQGVTNTADSIQTLSLWLLHHKAHHQKIVAAWMKVLQKDKIAHRLTMFHLANDVIQNSKRKGFLLFVNSFAEVLKEATLLVRDEHIRQSVQRVFTIWEQRNVYTPEFIADLRAILTNSKVPSTAPSKLLGDFKPDMVIKKLKTVMKLEVDSTSKLSSINLSKLNATDAEIVQQLKDRVHGQQFKRDFDKNIQNMEELVETMKQEITERNELILLLEQSEIYYDTQRGEAKVVANAYKNFDGRVKTLQKKLADLAALFPSPVPSPSVDAPSPSTSDHELELKLPNDNTQTNELENLEDAPSPVGSPEGLNLSPVPKKVESNSKIHTKKSVGNPIPTLSNFFTHEESGMTSWLGAFSAKKETSSVPPVTSETKKNDPSSLDSRLSNLLQNIPNLPSGLQSSLFSNTSGNNTPTRNDLASSPVPSKKDKLPEGALTPLKDDCSGQNTPLQDEDSHSFFNKLASTNKTQSPKDILKGLTNLIQSATEKDDKKEKFTSFSSSELYDQPGGMSSFIKNIMPSITQQSSSPSTYFSSPQTSMSAPIRTATGASTTTVVSYQTTTFDGVPSYSTQSPKSEAHMSYIPSLVPSTHHDNFGFPKNNFSTDEYNPEMELFNTDMDLENPDSDNDVPSPEMEPLSPVAAIADSDERPRAAIPGRRLSTLITVVTDDSPVENLVPDKMFPPDDMYKSDKENVTQELRPPWNDSQPMYTTTDGPPLAIPDHIAKGSPNEEFFIGKTEPSIPSYFSAPPPPPNGESMKFPEAAGMNENSRIETVQSHREDQNGRWFGNNWTENNAQSIPEGPSMPPNQYGPPDGEFYNQNYPQQNYHPRPNWAPRHRPDMPYDNSFHQKRNHSHQPYGPPQNKRFPFRGRGWGRPQY